MDARKFDALTRMLARVGTRRQVVAGAAAVAVGGIEAADAHKRKSCRAGRQTCQRDNQCCSGTCRRGVEVPLKDRNRCACGDGETQCGNACVDLAHDERNCGSCGTRCRTGDLCCPDGCRNTKTDEENCGACGNHCATGEVCADGSCVDLASDPANCGAVGRVCKSDSPCVSGMCDYRQLCVDALTGGDYCAFDASGNLYLDHFNTVLGDWSDLEVSCENDQDCQYHPLCDLDTNTCICERGDVWGASPDDNSLFLPGICYALYVTSSCGDPDATSGHPRCNSNVEGDAWGSYTQDYRWDASNVCLSSEECQSFDEKCDQDGYRCGCVYAFANPPGNVRQNMKPQCFRDNTAPL